MKTITIDLKSTSEIEVIQDCELKAIFVGKGNESLTSKISIVHKIPNIKSRVSIKAVLYNTSKFDFEGVLKIEKGAVNTDTYLKIDCLVVGGGAMAMAVPSLEIKESAVKAGHGATIGYIDQEMMYYLQSKGLDSSQAESVIVKAFLNSK